jgi:ArsR family transcriptional regulator
MAARREGKWMHYRVERPENVAAAAILDAVYESFKSDLEIQSDRSRLSRACWEPERFVSLQGVPIPIQSETAVV